MLWPCCGSYHNSSWRGCSCIGGHQALQLSCTSRTQAMPPPPPGMSCIPPCNPKPMNLPPSDRSAASTYDSLARFRCRVVVLLSDGPPATPTGQRHPYIIPSDEA
jgi:hypothetical protein